MNVSLTPEMETWIQERVSTGLYGSASEVVREAIRIFRSFEINREARLGELRDEIAVGLADLDAGRSMPFTEETVAEILARGRSRRG